MFPGATLAQKVIILPFTSFKICEHYNIICLSGCELGKAKDFP